MKKTVKMVRVGDMLKKKKSFRIDEADEARRMFVDRSTATVGDDGTPGGGPPGINFKVFKEVMKDLVEKINMRAELSDQVPIPNKRDLKAAFKIADDDHSGFVDEREFARLYDLVLKGKVGRSQRGSNKK